MKIKSLLFFLFTSLYSFGQSITNPHIMGQSGRSYYFNHDLAVMDTLDVEGVLWYPPGAGASKVLTSDANGIATWQVNSAVDTTNFWNTYGNAGTSSGTNFIGTTGANSFRIRTNNIVRVHVDSTTGRVGIGTVTPGSLFEVSGLLKVSLSNFSVFFGEDAGKTNSGNYGVGVGYHALGGSGAGTTGERNTCLGFDAGGRITSGIYNNFFGVGAGQVATTADHSVGIGASTLGLTTTGDDNTAVGSESMASNTTGAQNDAFGRHSLNKLISGIYNAAIGGGSMYAATTADSNTVLGVDGGRYIVTGGFNVAIGTNSTPALIVPFDNLTGTFTVGEKVNNTTISGPGGYAYIKMIVGTNLFLGGGSGLVNGWANNDSLTGVSSGATAKINGTPSNPNHTITMGAGPANALLTEAVAFETGEINIGNVLRGTLDITGDSTKNTVRLTGNTKITDSLDVENSITTPELILEDNATSTFSKLYAIKVSLDSSEIRNGASTPVEVIAAPGAGYAIDIVMADAYLTAGDTAYNATGEVQLLVNGIPNMTTNGPNFLQGAANQGANMDVSTSLTGTFEPNTNCEFTCSQNSTVGNGTLAIYILYRIVKM